MPPINGKPRATTIKPEARLYWQTTDKETAQLYLGHVLDCLALLPEKSVHCVVTSPPYWGLRDYKTGSSLEIGSEPSPDCGTQGQAQCGRCFVCTMVAVFREVRRVLREDGTCWLNLGDTYSGGKSGRADDGSGDPTSRLGPKRDGLPNNSGMGPVKQRPATQGIPSGNLIGVPWRVALALQADGWVLRQDIIWHKPSPMPESVRNRCTKAHEYIFLLTKGQRYYCDMEAIKEKSVDPESLNGRKPRDPEGDKFVKSEGGVTGFAATRGFSAIEVGTTYQNRNKRSVWTVSSQGYEGAHFATFPPKLIEPCILAGTSAKGCCAECGAPWRRVVKERQLKRERPNDYVKRTGEEGTGNSCANSVAGVEVKTVGWEPTCECNGRFEKRRERVKRARGYVPTGWVVGVDDHTSMSHQTKEGRAKAKEAVVGEEIETTVIEYVSDLPLDEHPIIPCVVLDPFIGAGTTSVVCLEHGRRSIGIDLSEIYLRENAVPRVEGVLLSRPTTAYLVPTEERVAIRVGVAAKIIRG